MSENNHIDMLTAEAIEKIIEDELNLLSPIDNWHGITRENVQQYLTTPYKRYFIEPISGSRQQYWVVLDEDVESASSGYLVIYSEEEECFGLAVKGNMEHPGIGTFIGLYGGFIDALGAM